LLKIQFLFLFLDWREPYERYYRMSRSRRWFTKWTWRSKRSPW